MVHGMATTSARTWGDNGWFDLLQDIGREPYPLDLMGHGTATRPTDPAAYDRLEDELLERFPVGVVDAVGFSLGARTLLILAAQHPERFHSLIVSGVGQNLFREHRPEESEALALAFEGHVSPDDRRLGYFAGLAEAPDQDPAALAALVRRTNRVALTDEDLARISCPVLVVIGDRDDAGPADPLVERLPDARLIVLRNVDHFATPKDLGFIDAALAFLSGAA
jgi:pimeloyl-ACP methyl ester carboxylesterase